MSKRIDILAIGDVVTDAFIELLPAEEKIMLDTHKHPLLCLPYGTKIPFKDAIIVPGVGNAANAAVANARLGLETAFMSNIGDDAVGDEIIKALHDNGVSTEFVRENDGFASNYHYVLWYKDDRTILIKHEDYPYKWPQIREHQKPAWIYLSSIAQSGDTIHEHLAKYLASNPDCKLVFQPGTFQIREGRHKLADLYKSSAVFAANKEEYQQILESKETDEQKLMAAMRAIGPQTVLLTDGPRGAFASDGRQVVFMPPYPDPKPPLDRTGAGDSYASTFTAALIHGKDLATGLSWAGVNSMSVVQKIGAQAGLLTQNEIDAWLHKAPASYKVRVVDRG